MYARGRTLLLLILSVCVVHALSAVPVKPAPAAEHAVPVAAQHVELARPPAGPIFAPDMIEETPAPEATIAPLPAATDAQLAETLREAAAADEIAEMLLKYGIHVLKDWGWDHYHARWRKGNWTIEELGRCDWGDRPGR